MRPRVPVIECRPVPARAWRATVIPACRTAGPGHWETMGETRTGTAWAGGDTDGMEQRVAPGREDRHTGTAGPGSGDPARHPDGTDARRRIPRTDTLLRDPRLAAAAHRLGERVVKSAIRQAQDRAREGTIPPEHVPETALALVPDTAGGLRPVINATGVLLHTNLGRAPLSQAARQAVAAAAGPTDVELDLTTGVRARRGRSALAALRARVPSAGDVHGGKNRAAALVLAASAMAAG